MHYSLTTYRKETSWRMVRLGDGSIRPIEILKADKSHDKGKSKQVNGIPEKSTKKVRCGCCQMLFEEENLPGGVSKMSIARLRNKNDQKNRKKNFQVDVKVPLKDTMPFLMKNGGCETYEMTKVCAFCFQFFEYDDVEESKFETKLGSFYHVPGARNATVHHDSVKADPKRDTKTYQGFIRKPS